MIFLRLIALSSSFAYAMLISMVAALTLQGIALTPFKLVVDVGISAGGGLVFGIMMCGIGRYTGKRNEP
jgi:hypothetical protein